MPSLIPPYSLRLPEVLKEKLRVLAEKEKRSVNKQIELIIENYIAEYEQQNGPI